MFHLGLLWRFNKNVAGTQHSIWHKSGTQREIVITVHSGKKYKISLEVLIWIFLLH